jgi:hypothetical protein
MRLAIGLLASDTVVELHVEAPQWYSNSRLASDINEIFNIARMYLKNYMCFTGARLSSLVKLPSSTMTPVPEELELVVHVIFDNRTQTSLGMM